MTFIEWLNKQKGFVNKEDIKEKVGHLHVIGTCGECEHWNPKAVALEGWGNCDSYKVAAHTHDTDAKRHEDHGCVHFEKKEV